MKNVRIVMIALFILGFMIMGIVQPGTTLAKSPKMKMTTDIPASIDWEYQMAYQRGIEAMNWAMPAVSMLSMRKGNFL